MSASERVSSIIKLIEMYSVDSLPHTSVGMEMYGKHRSSKRLHSNHVTAIINRGENQTGRLIIDDLLHCRIQPPLG